MSLFQEIVFHLVTPFVGLGLGYVLGVKSLGRAIGKGLADSRHDPAVKEIAAAIRGTV